MRRFEHRKQTEQTQYGVNRGKERLGRSEWGQKRLHCRSAYGSTGSQIEVLGFDLDTYLTFFTSFLCNIIPFSMEFDV